MTLLALLLLQAAEGDALLKAVREKIAAASTVRVEFEIRDGRRADRVMQGTLQLKGKDKWAFSMKQAGRLEKDGYLLYDGARLVAGGAAEGAPMGDGSETGARFREILPAVPLGVGFDLVFSPPDKAKSLPSPAEAKEEPRETLDGKEYRVVSYVLQVDGDPGARKSPAVKLYLDPQTLLPARREMAPGGARRMIEVFGAFVLDGPLPDTEFVYATPARLAAARARQLARSVDLFTRFAGRPPASLAELGARPADLPAGVFWPDGGFVLVAPGKDASLAVRDGVLHAQVGDASAPAAPGTGRAIGAPSDRLKAHFTSRVRLQLVAAAARAWREAYGTLPEDLAKRPGPELPWPDGGWLPDGKMPLDGAGKPFVFVPAGPVVRIQASDPASRKLTLAMLTAEETAALEAAATPRLSTSLQADAAAAFSALGADDFEVRQKAEDTLRRLGEAVVPLIEARMKIEKDVESTARLGVLLGAIPRAPSPWKAELAGLVTYVGLSGAAASNERNGSTTLKTFASAQADFRANDRDGNKIQDFWTGDVAGLYLLKSADGEMIKLIEISAAAADAKPLAKGAAGGRHPGLEGVAVAAPKAGYFFQAMTHDKSSGTAEGYATNTAGQPDLGPVHNHSRFGICAFPADYGASGTRTFIINEGNTIFWKDTQGEPVLEWPSDQELKDGWAKLG
jgi:hypothetical protein